MSQAPGGNSTKITVRMRGVFAHTPKFAYIIKETNNIIFFYSRNNRKEEPLPRIKPTRQPIPIAASQAATLKKITENRSSLTLIITKKKTRTNLSKDNNNLKILFVFIRDNKKTAEMQAKPNNIF